MRRHPKLGIEAVEGLPMTLVIVMIILAITVPLIFGSFRAYDRARVEAELVAEIDGFISMAQMLYTSGPGNSAIIEFSASSGALASVESVTFGDSPGSPLISTVRYIINNRAEVIVPTSTPNVPLMSSAGETSFMIAAGTYHIKAECLTIERDLNGDSLFPDACICLSLVG